MYIIYIYIYIVRINSQQEILLLQEVASGNSSLNFSIDSFYDTLTIEVYSVTSPPGAQSSLADVFYKGNRKLLGHKSKVLWEYCYDSDCLIDTWEDIPCCAEALGIKERLGNISVLSIIMNASFEYQSMMVKGEEDRSLDESAIISSEGIIQFELYNESLMLDGSYGNLYIYIYI